MRQSYWFREDSTGLFKIRPPLQSTLDPGPAHGTVGASLTARIRAVGAKGAPARGPMPPSGASTDRPPAPKKIPNRVPALRFTPVGGVFRFRESFTTWKYSGMSNLSESRSLLNLPWYSARLRRTPCPTSPHPPRSKSLCGPFRKV